MCIRSLLILVALVVTGCAPYSTDPHSETPSKDETLAEVQRLAQQCCDATCNGQFDVVADLTYPEIVELFGGRDKLIQAMRDEFSVPDRPKLIEMKTGVPLPLQEFGRYQVTFVPTATTVSNGPTTIRRHTHMLGVSSDRGRNWHFISGNKLSHERVRFFIPEFPDSIALPQNAAKEVLAE